MKLNWGTSLVIAMVLFISFILYFVISISTDTKYDHDLVTEEYYQKEMVYQQEIDAEKNSQELSTAITVKKVSDGWQLSFPKELEASKIKGGVTMYRPSNKILDFETPITISDSKMLIPNDRLVEGRWDVIVDYTYEGKNYMFKKSILH